MEIVSDLVCSCFRPTMKPKSIQKHLEVRFEISKLLSGVLLSLRKNGSKPITVLILFDLLPSRGEIGWNKTPNRSSSLDTNSKHSEATNPNSVWLCVCVSMTHPVHISRLGWKRKKNKEKNTKSNKIWCTIFEYLPMVHIWRPKIHLP